MLYNFSEQLNGTSYGSLTVYPSYVVWQRSGLDAERTIFSTGNIWPLTDNKWHMFALTLEDSELMIKADTAKTDRTFDAAFLPDHSLM